MPVIGRLAGLANAIESLWTFYVVLSGLMFGVSFGIPFSPAPWWLIPAIVLQIIVATILLGAAYGCMTGYDLAFPFGAIASLALLFSFILMFGIIPDVDLAVALLLCAIAAVGNTLVWFQVRAVPTPTPLLG